MATADELAKLVAAVCEGVKYRQLDPSLVEAVAAAELAKGRGFKLTVKAVRNKLHQVAGAYFPDRPAYAAWFAAIAQAPDEHTRRDALHSVMAQHASTRERLPFLDTFYTTIFADLPPVHSVLDLACGLNPLARPWMPLADDARYLACDIYQDQIAFLNRVFTRQGQPGGAFISNLLDAVPTAGVDVALLLKTIPCLEQLDKNIGPRLLTQINAPVIIASFPARSLGGHSKGMVQNYADHFAELVPWGTWQITRFDFPTEIVFRLQKRAPDLDPSP